MLLADLEAWESWLPVLPSGAGLGERRLLGRLGSWPECSHTGARGVSIPDDFY